MKVLHIPFTYRPNPMGGTEVYVAALARELARRGVESAIAAPTTEAESFRLEDEGMRVHRFAVRLYPTLDELYGEGSELGAVEFARVLDEERPDVVHMHAFTSGASLRVAREASRRGIPLVVTYHTPTVSCLRGTMLRDGREPCDGEIQVERCARCVLAGQMPGVAAGALSRVPPSVGRAIGRLGIERGPLATLRRASLVERRLDAFTALMREATVVVAVSAWVRDVLLRNGVDPAKIVLSRQGVIAAAPDFAAPDAAGAGETPRPVRAALFGRLDPVKGIDVVLRAMARRPGLALTLDVFGVLEVRGDGYDTLVHALAKADARVRLLPPIAPDLVIPTLRDYHVALVPSQWLETGPLTVLEAFAAGIPVVGSRLGGIPERVRDGVDGLLVGESSSDEAWAVALERVVDEPGLLARLRSGVRPPRTAADVADEMMLVYARATGGAQAAQAAASGAGARE